MIRARRGIRDRIDCGPGGDDGVSSTAARPRRGLRGGREATAQVRGPGRVVVAVLGAPPLGAFSYAGPARGRLPLLTSSADQVPNDLGGDELQVRGHARTRATPEHQQPPDRDSAACAAPVADRNPALDTAWKTTTGRPDVTIAVLDSGIKWNNAGAMHDLRFKTRLNRGELPVPQRTTARRRTTRGADCSRAAFTHAAQRRQRRRRLQPRATTPATSRVNVTDPRRVGPGRRPRPAGHPDRLQSDGDRRRHERLRRRHRRLGLPRQRQRPVRRRPVRARHRRGEGSTAEANNGDRRALGSCPNCMVDPHAGRRHLHRRRQPLRRRPSSTRSTTARWSCSRRSARSTTPASRATPSTTPTTTASPRSSRPPTRPRSTTTSPTCRRRSSSTRCPTRTRSRRRRPAGPVLPGLQRLHQLQRQDHARDPVDELLLRRGRRRAPGSRAWSSARRSTPTRGRAAVGDPSCCGWTGPSWQARPVRDHPERGPPADGDGADRPSTGGCPRSGRRRRLRGSPRRSPLPPLPSSRPARRCRCRAAPHPNGPGGALQAVDANRGTGGIPTRARRRCSQLPGPRRPRPVLRLRAGRQSTAVEALLDDHRRPARARRSRRADPARGRDLLARSGTSRSIPTRPPSPSAATSGRAARTSPAAPTSRPATTRTTGWRAEPPATSSRCRWRRTAPATGPRSTPTR